MFKRKKPLDFFTQIAKLIWPEKGWKRNFLYYWKRLTRIPDSPHSISLGFSIGVFFAFSPFLGLHTVLSIFFSWVFRANILSSIIGTFTGNPITYPLMWAFAIGIGGFLSENIDSDYERIGLFNIFETDFLASFLIGSLILGLLFGVSSYFIIKYCIVIFKGSRGNIGK